MPSMIRCITVYECRLASLVISQFAYATHDLTLSFEEVER